MQNRIKDFFDTYCEQLSQEEFDSFLEHKRQKFCELESFYASLSAMLEEKGGWDAEEDIDDINARRTRSYRLLDIENSEYKDSLIPISERDIFVEKLILKGATDSAGLSVRKRNIQSAVENYSMFLNYTENCWRKIGVTIQPSTP